MILIKTLNGTIKLNISNIFKKFIKIDNCTKKIYQKLFYY